MVERFYNELSPFYHLIFPDWDASMRRQGNQLTSLIESEWPGASRVLDVSCGIGTQTIGLAINGYNVVGSDLSARAIQRAKEEADLRQLEIAFSVCDMRNLESLGTGFDTVISADNAVSHLLSDDAIRSAFEQMYGCLSSGGGCVITVRDYETETRGTNLVKPYGVRVEDRKRYLIFQVWDFDGDCYDLTFFIIEENLITGDVVSHTFRTRYYAISTLRLCELMIEAGFENVRRIDGLFYQPVLVGTRVR